ncbi:hypothetical protein TIFTF001_042925 [Ficus carica]|uniref:Uncharacterized protein n=1 Tax=Ficus carica TaxID=3494 RepID=A0AA88CKB8_FICCA|nr:hypothetical protein TIFTF001_042925 [Ficus carica]
MISKKSVGNRKTSGDNFLHSRDSSTVATRHSSRRIASSTAQDRVLRSSAQPGSGLPACQQPSVGAGSYVRVYTKSSVSLILQPTPVRHASQSQRIFNCSTPPIFVGPWAEYKYSTVRLFSQESSYLESPQFSGSFLSRKGLLISRILPQEEGEQIPSILHC